MQSVTARTYLMVWLWLIGLTGIEVFLGYIHVPPVMLRAHFRQTVQAVAAGGGGSGKPADLLSASVQQ